MPVRRWKSAADLPIITNQHVGRLDVAMHQPLGVGGGQRRAGLDGQLDGRAGCQPALAGQ
jgi:hypothetical protein